MRLSGGTRNNPQIVRESRSGAPATRPEPRAKTGLFPPETAVPVPGGGSTEEQLKKIATIPPKPEGEFWQIADGVGGHPRRPNPRSAMPRSGLSLEHGPTLVRDAAGGVAQWRRPAMEEGTPAEILAGCGSSASRVRARLMRGPWWCGVRGAGPARTVPPSIYL